MKEVVVGGAGGRKGDGPSRQRISLGFRPIRTRGTLQMNTGLGLMPLITARSQYAFRFIDRRGMSRQITFEASDDSEALDVLLEAVPAIVDQIAAAPVNPSVRASMAQQTAWQHSNGEVEGFAERYAPIPNGGRY